jgi:predicted nucleic acid binding AN1-type Zn finger protein
LGVAITPALPTNYFTARRRLFFTSGREHALIFTNRRLQPPQRKETSVNKPKWFDSYISGNLSAAFSLHYPKAECIGTGYVWQLSPALSMQVLFDEWGTVLVELCESHGDAIEHHSIAYELKGVVHQDLPPIIGLVSEQEKAWTLKHCIEWQANIPADIRLSAKARKNLSTTCTGGGFDYISRILWDNGPELILHAAGDEPPGPDRLDGPCEVWLFLTADWAESYDKVLRFAFDTAVEGMDFMSGFTSAKEGV